MLQPDFKPCPVYKWIVSWSARCKTGPVYAKSKSGSISQLVRSKSRPAHVLDGLPPRAHGPWSFHVPNKSYRKEAIWEQGYSQFFFKLALALIIWLAGAPSIASVDRSQYPICAGVGWVSLARLPCLYLACMLQ